MVRRMSKPCPWCDTENEPGAERCDCGFRFGVDRAELRPSRNLGYGPLTFVMVVLAAFVWMITRDRDERPQAQAASSQPAPVRRDPGAALKLQSDNGSVEGDIVRIRGKIHNNGPDTFRLVSLRFSVFNAAGARVGTAIDTIDGLKGWTTWEYEASCVCPSGRSHELQELKGYPE